MLSPHTGLPVPSPKYGFGKAVPPLQPQKTKKKKTKKKKKKKKKQYQVTFCVTSRCRLYSPALKVTAIQVVFSSVATDAVIPDRFAASFAKV